MNVWILAEYGAWLLSALSILWMLTDLLRITRGYSEEFLTSSREGELEAIEEAHHHAR